MAVAFGSAGISAAGTTSLLVTYPSTVNAGDLVAIGVVNKYPTNGPATPAGWTKWGPAQGGLGSAGSESGDVYVTWFTRIADGTEASTTVSISIPSANVSRAQMVRYTKSSSKLWDIAGPVSGADTTANTSWSVTATTSLDIISGDMVIVCTGANGSGAATRNAQAMSATGATFAAGGERHDSSTGNGDHAHLYLSDHSCTGGPASSAPTFTCTAPSAAGNSPAGASIFLRLREVDDNAVLSATEASDTIASTATVECAATLSATEAADTISATATVQVAATLSATEVADTISATATALISATLSATEAADTLAATSEAHLEATLAATEDADSVEATASAPAAATLSATEADDAIASDAVATASAVLDATEDEDTLDATSEGGEIADPPVTLPDYETDVETTEIPVALLIYDQPCTLELTIMPFVIKAGARVPGIAGQITVPAGIDLTDVDTLTMRYAGRTTATREVEVTNDGLAEDSPALDSGDPTVWDWHYNWESGDTDTADEYVLELEADVDGEPLVCPSVGTGSFRVEARIPAP